MFESLKVISECKKTLKKHNISYNEEFRIFKKMGLIHCQINDWRGPVEVDGFPVLTIKAAVSLLIESCAFEHYVLEEKNKRELLIRDYPLGYGIYEPRKYIFENVLKVIKDYDGKKFSNLIKKYTKYINTTKKSKQKWSYNDETAKFEIASIAEYSAVIVNKTTAIVRIYNQDPCGGRLDDNIYKFISENIKEDLIEFIFSNNGSDRFYLKVYNPKFIDSSENYIVISKADKVLWIYDNNLKSIKQEKVFIFDGVNLHIDGTINI